MSWNECNVHTWYMVYMFESCLTVSQIMYHTQCHQLLCQCMNSFTCNLFCLQCHFIIGEKDCICWYAAEYKSLCKSSDHAWLWPLIIKELSIVWCFTRQGRLLSSNNTYRWVYGNFLALSNQVRCHAASDQLSKTSMLNEMTICNGVPEMSDLFLLS